MPVKKGRLSNEDINKCKKFILTEVMNMRRLSIQKNMFLVYNEYSIKVDSPYWFKWFLEEFSQQLEHLENEIYSTKEMKSSLESKGYDKLTIETLEMQLSRYEETGRRLKTLIDELNQIKQKRIV